MSTRSQVVAEFFRTIFQLLFHTFPVIPEQEPCDLRRPLVRLSHRRIHSRHAKKREVNEGLKGYKSGLAVFIQTHKRLLLEEEPVLDMIIHS